jgi:hypothetical protein
MSAGDLREPRHDEELDWLKCGRIVLQRDPPARRHVRATGAAGCLSAPSVSRLSRISCNAPTTQAELTQDPELARAAYHVAINHGVQSVVDSYLSSRPAENRAWESYTVAQQEVNQSKDIGVMLDRVLGERALSEPPPHKRGAYLVETMFGH